MRDQNVTKTVIGVCSLYLTVGAVVHSGGRVCVEVIHAAASVSRRN